MDLFISNFNMKKKLIALTVVTSLAIVSVPSFFAISLFAFSSPYKDVFSSVLVDKIEYLKVNKDEEKIIFIGNSSIPFAIRCDLIEKHLPRYKAIDFGLYGSLGTKLMIDLSKDHIGPNDIVILSPEQSLQSQSLYFSGEDFLMATDDHFSYFFELDSNDKKRVIGDMPSFISKRLQYTMTNTVPSIDGIYVRDSFNEYFDISSPLADRNILKNDYDEVNLIDLNESLYDDSFIAYVNEFNKHVTNKGAKLYYAFAPTNPLAIRHKELLNDYQLKLVDFLDFPIINSLNDTMLHPLYFYDTNFHLNNSGAIIHTKNMIQSIKLLLEDTSITDIKEPDPPEKLDEEILDGDNSCADMFNYREVEGGYRIISLNEKGLNAKNIVLPFKYNDKVVKSFSENTFKKCENLESITIQQNINRLNDGIFSDSPKLKSITLTHKKPSEITVGRYLLKNASNFIKIYVRKEALHTFKLDYSRSQYSMNLFPLETK